MVATVSVMSVVAVVMVATAILMIAIMVTAAWAAVRRGTVIESQNLPSDLEGTGPQHPSVANAYASYFHCVANAGQEPLIFQELRRAQANFRPGVPVLHPNVEIAVGQKRCLTHRSLQCHRIA